MQRRIWIAKTHHKIYRCWTVYARSWRAVLFPVVLWFVVLGCSIFAAVVMANAPVSPVNTTLEDIWIIFYCCNITINIYATCMSREPCLGYSVSCTSPFSCYRLPHNARCKSQWQKFTATTPGLPHPCRFWNPLCLGRHPGLVHGDARWWTQIFHGRDGREWHCMFYPHPPSSLT